MLKTREAHAWDLTRATALAIGRGFIAANLCAVMAVNMERASNLTSVAASSDGVVLAAPRALLRMLVHHVAFGARRVACTGDAMMEYRAMAPALANLAGQVTLAPHVPKGISVITVSRYPQPLHYHHHQALTLGATPS